MIIAVWPLDGKPNRRAISSRLPGQRLGSCARPAPFTKASFASHAPPHPIPLPLRGRGYRDRSPSLGETRRESGAARSGGRRGWAADGLAAADDRLPDAPREGRHRLQEILEAARADEEHLGVGRDDGDVRLATAAVEEAQLAEDVALAQLGDDLALDPHREVTGEQDVEAVRLVVLD